MDKKAFNEVIQKLISDYFEPYYHCGFRWASDFTDYADSDWGYIADFYYPNSNNDIDVTLTVSASENCYYLHVNGIIYDQLPYNESLEGIKEYFTNVEDYKSWLENLKDEDLAEPGLYSEREQKIFEEVLKYKDFEDFVHQFEAEESIDLEISEETYYAFLVELKDCLQNNWGDNQGAIDIKSITKLIDTQIKEIQEEEEKRKHLLNEIKHYKNFMDRLDFLGAGCENRITDSDMEKMKKCEYVEDIVELWSSETNISYELISDDFDATSDDFDTITITFDFELTEDGDAIVARLGIERNFDVIHKDVHVCYAYETFTSALDEFLNNTLLSVLGSDAYKTYSGEIKKLKNTI